jgi:hypothetical protein
LVGDEVGPAEVLNCGGHGVGGEAAAGGGEEIVEAVALLLVAFLELGVAGVEFTFEGVGGVALAEADVVLVAAGFQEFVVG